MKLKAKRSVFRARKSQRVKTAHASDGVVAFMGERLRARRQKTAGL